MAKKADEPLEEAEAEDTLETPVEEIPVQGRESATEPIIAPDGHVVLSQEDIDARG